MCPWREPLRFRRYLYRGLNLTKVIDVGSRRNRGPHHRTYSLHQGESDNELCQGVPLQHENELGYVSCRFERLALKASGSAGGDSLQRSD